MKPIILASASPRRREICDLIGVPYTVCPATGEERFDSTLTPEQAIVSLARQKAEQVAQQHPGSRVLGADTAVFLGDTVFGKPDNTEEAKAMLRALSGNTHRVITGVWLCDGDNSRGFADVAQVTFAAMTEQEIEDYVASGEPMDKAGAYAVQGIGSRYIEGLNGDFFTVMGLPAHKTYQLLREG